MNRRGGLALILVAGVLGLLVAVATAFVMMTQLERRASRQRLYVTKARLLARSGVEDALARLSNGQETSLVGSAFAGEDYNDDRSLSPGPETDAEVFRIGDLNREDCPVGHALRPSFFVRDPSGNPATRPVAGRRRGYSGFLKSDLAVDGNVYALKVEDESAKINVNGGFLDAQNRDAASGDAIPDHRDPDVRVNPADPKDTGLGWNFQLARILGVLGNQPEVGLSTLGTDVLVNRPAGGYVSIEDLQRRIGTTRDLSPYLTTRSWVDRKVIHPNGYGSQDTLPQPATRSGMSRIKKDRLQLVPEDGGRPPVNLNAAPRPVLAALIRDLKGTTWQAVEAPRSTQIDATTASDIADRIIIRRVSDPFDTWGEFSAFCDTLVDQGVIVGMASPTELYGGGNLCGADLLKADFDPNTDLNKQLPDQLLFRWIDKSDLSVWSTEGSLGPTGTFHISSLGRLLDRNGGLLAQHSLSVTVEAFRLLRQTTQQDFVAGRAFGDDYLSRSSGGAFGHRTTGATASWRGPSWGVGQGLAAMTYPCAPTALPGNASSVDGYIGLATVQDVDTSPAQGPLFFLHHMDDSLTADSGNPSARMAGFSWSSDLQATLTQSVWPAPPTEPSTFLPDGLHCQPLRSTAHQPMGNFPVSWTSGVSPYPSNHGVISYWVKPTHAQAPPQSSSIGPSSHLVLVRNVGVYSQVLMIGESEMWQGCWGIMVENRASNTDLVGASRHARASRSGFSAQALKPDLRWYLVTAWFDTDEALAVDELAIRVLGFRGPWTVDNISGGGSYGSPFTTSDNEDLLINSSNRFVLGAIGGGLDMTFANQIIDEFAIYDFGDVGGFALGAAGDLAGTLANNRYADGRYYKGDDARFLSAVLEPDPGGPARLLSARWTGYLPRENRQEILVERWSVPAMPATGTPRLPDGRLQNSRLELSLLDGAGTLASAPLQALSQGTPINLSLPRFRYRVRFVNEIAVPNPNDDGILETPFLDDITFAWQPAQGPRILTWSP